MKNKKGMGLEWYFLIVAFFIGTMAYFMGYIGPHKVIGNYIGQYQFEIIKASNKAEKSLFYIDQSAKYSLQQAIYDLAQNGGFSEIDSYEEIDTSGITDETTEQSKKGCGKFSGANVWYEIKKDSTGEYTQIPCFDEKFLTTNLEYRFNKNLNKYLSNYPSNILTDNYNYEIRNSLEILGKAVSPLKFSIIKDETKAIVKEPVEVKMTAEAKEFVDFTGTELCAKGKRCLLAKDAYELLLKAQEIANQNKVSLEVIFGYRTLEEQNVLWKRNPNSKYVCPPSPKCPHLTGNVVDVKIKEKRDWNLLHKIMTQAGWVRYTKEPWHFECCGTTRYAKAKAQGVTAIV